MKKTNIPEGFQNSYVLWHKKYIKANEKWAKKVNKNPFIAIERHINEDTITDLLAHILQTNMAIKKQFITFLLNKAKENEIIKSIKEITDKDEENTEIETQYSIQNQGKKSRLDLFIKIPSKYYIIIENKIFDAPEQPNQMERYFSGIRELDDYQKEEIIAFFATPDGRGECKTSGKDSVIPLAFYTDDLNKKTIYSVLLGDTNGRRQQGLTSDFCFYLKYRFNNPQSVSFLQNPKNNCGIDLCSNACFEKLFKGNYPSISKYINAYTAPENYFYQLLKVHALNCYLLKEFEKDDCSYHAVFDGIRIKRQAKIGNTDCNVYFETKYDKNYFFMVITICSLNEIDGEIKALLKGKGASASGALYKEQNKLNKESSYSLWLWIQDPSELKKKEDKIKKFNIRGEGYMAYIDFIFVECMKKIFDGIQKKEIDPEALKIYSKYYNDFQRE